MVAVKRIRLEGLREDEVTQLMREVDLVKSLSHPSIVKYEGMARDNDTLSIVLEFVFPSCTRISIVLMPHIQVCREWLAWSDPEGVRKAE